jgi:putative hydrolase of the HAD superfamily
MQILARGIQAIFFDMGGTLERVWHTPEERLRAALGLKQMMLARGMDPHLSDVEFYEVITAGYARYHQWSMETMEELTPRRVWSEFILAGQPVDEDKLAVAAEDLMFALENSFYHRKLRPEVPTVLEATRMMGLKIGLISNICSRDLVPANLEMYGIRNYFDPIVLSSEYGRRKPDPAIFHYAARLANVPTGACIHVGDRIARDVSGASRAGFGCTVQIINDFNHGEVDDGAQPDIVIHDLSEILDMLKSGIGSAGIGTSLKSHIHALLFDAGDVLYYRPERGRNLKMFLEEMGVSDLEVPIAEIDLLKKLAYDGQIPQSMYRETFLRLYGLTDAAQIERGKAMMDMDDNNIVFFKGVAETLRKLKENGFMLGIITDTAMPIYVKLGWFERGGFGNVWDSIISSADMGAQKPDPKTYHAALQQLGINVDQAVFVGHHPQELAGARAIGMKTIAFNYEKNIESDYFIDKFEDLLKVPILIEDSPENTPAK